MEPALPVVALVHDVIHPYWRALALTTRRAPSAQGLSSRFHSSAGSWPAGNRERGPDTCTRSVDASELRAGDFVR